MSKLMTNATGREIFSRPKKFEWVALGALILAATALRFFRLDAQDIWGDEAFSIFLSGQPLAQIIAGGADTHPPLYPVLLFFWLRLVGDPSASSGAFATRALSALIGILIVPLIFILGKRIANARVAWFAAILATVSPLLIYYSQETRMYELVTVLMLASFALLPAILRGKRGKTAFAFTTLLAMYTHYSAFYVWITQNFFVAWLWMKSAVSLRHMSLRGAADREQGVEKTVVEFQIETAQQDAQATKQHLRRTQVQMSPGGGLEIASRKPLAMTHPDAGIASRKPLAMTFRRWLLLQLALIIAYIPWILAQTGFLSAKSSARFDEWSWRGVEIIFGKTLLAFSAGLTMEPPVLQTTAIAFFVLLALGIISGWMPSRAGQMGGRERGSPFTLIAPLYFFVPLIVAFIVNPILPFFFERYVLVALPGFLLTAALGLEFLARKSNALAISALALLLLSNLQSLNNYYFDDAYAKGRYGQMMAYVSAHARPGDALVLNNPLQKPLYRYYAPRDVPTFFLPDGAPLEDAASRAELEKITREHARVWLVMFGNPAEYDPTNYLQRTLGANAHRSYAQGFVDAALSLYLSPAAAESALTPLRATLGETIELRGYRLDRASAAPRDDLRLTLEWRAAARIEKSYKVFAHLIGGFNPATNSPVWAQMDGAPVGGTRATTQWQAGEAITDRYGLNLPANIPPGEYVLEVGMYDAATGARLAVMDENGNRVAADRVALTVVRVNQ